MTLSKTFETKEDPFGFKNYLEISGDYNPDYNSIEDITVTSYSQRKGVFIDLTEIFETVPELITMVDNIDWREIYHNENLEYA